ncbi:MAG TPA: ribosome maturation factor RimP [Burkholderiaceae bacterium]|jgi:ribosome maturation factor RimP|nr:ribosome maturation factor RimP [Burkholderiaceae bacterium]
MADVASDLYRTVEYTVRGLGYQLVDVERLGAGLLRVSVDTEKGVGLEDCERVSRQLSHVFAVEQVDYQRLEVSSPGLDRRLRTAEDFARFTGKEINVQLYAPSVAAGGRKRLRGRVVELVGAAGEERLQLQRVTDDAPAAHGRTPSKTGPKGRATAPTQIADVIEIALKDIDKARLVPELDFRPARLNASRAEAMNVSAGSLGSEPR